MKEEINKSDDSSLPEWLVVVEYIEDHGYPESGVFRARSLLLAVEYIYQRERFWSIHGDDSDWQQSQEFGFLMESLISKDDNLPEFTVPYFQTNLFGDVRPPERSVRNHA